MALSAREPRQSDMLKLPYLPTMGTSAQAQASAAQSARGPGPLQPRRRQSSTGNPPGVDTFAADLDVGRLQHQRQLQRRLKQQQEHQQQLQQQQQQSGQSVVLQPLQQPALKLSESLASLQSSSVTPRNRRELHRHFDDNLQEAYGHATHKLQISDVHRNTDLKEELARLPLNEYFDDRGTMRFARLGLSFAARHHEATKNNFGNWVDGPLMTIAGPKKQSARAYFLATEAIEKDAEYRATRKGKILEGLDRSQMHKVEDVQERQLQVLFSEVPNFRDHLPEGIREKHLLPLEASKEEERTNRSHNDKTCAYLTDRSWRTASKASWMLNRGEVLFLCLISNLWMRASHGTSAGNYPGIDRPTFCRMILDIGLVDQVKVPYFWAVSLFDEAARIGRCCGRESDTAMAHLTPVLPTLSRWSMIGVLDTILRMHFTVFNKGKFFQSLLAITKVHLPPHVIQESCLQEEMVSKYLHDPDILVVGGPNGEGGLERFGVKAPASDEKEGSSGRPNAVADPSEDDMQKEQAARDFYCRAMLVEPEVLNLLAQHQSVFETLHKCYAVDDDLSYGALLQFCLDFGFSPAIASANFVKKVYESVFAQVRKPQKPGDEAPACPAKSRKDASKAGKDIPPSPGVVVSVPVPPVPAAAAAPIVAHSRSSISGALGSSSRRPAARSDGDGLDKEVAAGGKSGRRLDRSASLATPQDLAKVSSAAASALSNTAAAAASSNCSSSNSKKDASGSARGRASASEVVPGSAAAATLAVYEMVDEPEKWPPTFPWQGYSELAVKATKVDKALRVSISTGRNILFKDRADLDKFSTQTELFVTCTTKSSENHATTLYSNTIDKIDSATEVNFHLDSKIQRYHGCSPLEFALWSKSADQVLAKGMLPAEKFLRDPFVGEIQLDSLIKNLPAVFLKVKVKLLAADIPHILKGKSGGIFGVGAFMEAICRICFAYLGSYGNSQQQNASGLARTVWLLTYLHSSFTHLRDSYERRSAAGPVKIPESLRKALSYTAEELWDLPFNSASLGSDPLALPSMRPGLPDDPVGEIKKKRQAGKKTSKDADDAQTRRRRGHKRAPSVSVPGTPRYRSLGGGSVSAAVSTPMGVSGAAAPLAAAAGSTGAPVAPTTPALGRSGSGGGLPAGERFAPVVSDGPWKGMAANTDQAAATVPMLSTDSGPQAGLGEGSGPQGKDPPSSAPGATGSGSPSSGGGPSPTGRTLRRRNSRLKDLARQADTELASTRQPALVGPESMKDCQVCVIEGQCQLCGGDAGKGHWGNPTCRGCSVVDRLNFRYHPLRALLIEWHPCVRPECPKAVMPLKAGRAGLTPPPMGRNDVLRG